MHVLLVYLAVLHVCWSSLSHIDSLLVVDFAWGLFKHVVFDQVRVVVKRHVLEDSVFLQVGIIVNISVFGVSQCVAWLLRWFLGVLYFLPCRFVRLGLLGYRFCFRFFFFLIIVLLDCTLVLVFLNVTFNLLVMIIITFVSFGLFLLLQLEVFILELTGFLVSSGQLSLELSHCGNLLIQLLLGLHERLVCGLNGSSLELRSRQFLLE